MPCPSCNAPLGESAVECPSCGVIVAKWKERRRVPPPAGGTPARQPARTPAFLIVGLGIGGAVLLITAFWYFSIRPRVLALQDTPREVRPGKPRTLKPIDAPRRPFDIAYHLPSSPLGAASNGSEIVIGNRGDPWGATRLRPAAEGGFTSQIVPIIEPRYRQKMNVVAFAWNGRNYVGIATGAWFGDSGDVFTIHDPATLAVLSRKAAPPLLGCLAWDGESYWAATRRHTQDSPEPSLLYRLDADFKVIATSEAPASGCQGLAWDGQFLWYGDVFTDTIHVISVSGTPRVVHKEELRLSYLSGIVAFQGGIWVADYGDDLLERIEPAVRLAWTGSPAPAITASIIPFAPRDRAPIPFARHQDAFADRKPDDAETLELAVELRDGAVFGSWKIWFGPEVFTRRESGTLPQFVRYKVTVDLPDGTDVEREFDGTPGEHAMSAVRLADAGAAGEYRVHIFLHAQYVTAEGQGHILNRSGSTLTLRQ
ncbi:MAG: hypothetical protein AABO58_21665 [Acidobacteriota bacterium]